MADGAAPRKRPARKAPPRKRPAPRKNVAPPKLHPPVEPVLPGSDDVPAPDGLTSPDGVSGPEAGAAADGPQPLPGPVDEVLNLLGELARAVLGPDGDARLAEGLSFLRRRLTGDYEVDLFGFDRELTDTVLLPLLRPLYRYWFRGETRGAENLPADGPALVVANHSGSIPLDSLMTQVAVNDSTERHLRMLGADLVFQMPIVADIARRSGTTLACNEDAVRLLTAGELVGVWPEGYKGLGKTYRERYKLQRFGRGGFVAAAIRAGAPIIPCAIVGAEEAYPMVGNFEPLARLLRLPYFPVTPTFPWLGLLGALPLPSKWMIEFGEPIPTDTYGPDAADDSMLTLELTDRVRDSVQTTLNNLLVLRG